MRFFLASIAIWLGVLIFRIDFGEQARRRSNLPGDNSNFLASPIGWPSWVRSAGAGPSRILFGPPTPAPQDPRPQKRLRAEQALLGGKLIASAVYFHTEIFKRPSSKREVAGYIRRGAHLAATRISAGEGCNRGEWVQLSDGGFVCTTRGVQVDSKPTGINLPYRLPDTSRALPYRYAKAKPKSLRYYRIPTPGEAKTLSRHKGKPWPEVVETQMNGAYFIALDLLVFDNQSRYYRSVNRRFIRARDLQMLTPPKMMGERIGRHNKLPIAFVWGDERPVYRVTKRTLFQIGVAQKHTRFAVTDLVRHDKEHYVVGPQGLLLARNAVRIATRAQKPSDIPPGNKWIHINLAEQTLIAYEGQEPVYATLVSSGKAGFKPPSGLFRINAKHVSTTMKGPDPDVAWYEVEEVPWTMFYWKSFAIHGAYWHNDFGKSRSHGCTNVPPIDAKWLFEWSEPKLPNRWHGIIESGTWVYVSS